MPLNILAWNNKIGLRNYFVGLCYKVMINSRDSWGYSYFIVNHLSVDKLMKTLGVCTCPSANCDETIFRRRLKDRLMM